MRTGVLWRGLVVRWLDRHRARSALAVFAVALGVAAFLASAAVADAVVRSAHAHVRALAGGADLAIEADETGLPADIVAEVAAQRGVHVALPRVLGWARVDGADGVRVLVVGGDPLAERRALGEGVVDVPLSDSPGSPWGPLAGAAIGPAVEKFRVADDPRFIDLNGPRGRVRLFAFAKAPAGPLLDAVRGRLVLTSLPTARAVLGRGATVDRIDVIVDTRHEADDVAEGLRALLAERVPGNVTVGPPRVTDDATADVMGTIDVAMRVGAVIALLIGVFLIHHTVAVGVAERRREVGILRAMGATRGQVRLVFSAEAGTLGLFGGALGVGLAHLLAAGALEGFAGAVTGAYFGGEAVTVEIPPVLAAGGVAIGVVVALVAAWGPASHAASLAPNDSIRRGPDGAHGTGAGAVKRRAGAAVVLAVVAAFLIGVPDALGPSTGYVALLLVLIAFLAAAPLVLQTAARLVAPLLAASFGVPGRLAADDLLRHPRRAALPAAALAFGLALVIETGGTLQSISDETVRWMEDNVAGDLFVSSGRSVMGGAGYTPLAADLRDELAAVSGVEHVVSVRFRRVPWRTTRLFVLGLDIEAYAPVWKLRLRDGALPDHQDALVAGTGCFVSENFVHLHGLDVGDTVTLPGSGGEAGFRILDVFSDYSWPRGTVLLHYPRMAELLSDPLVDEFSVTLAPGASFDGTAAAIDQAFGSGRDLVLTPAVEMRDQARAVLEDIFSLAYAQVAAALAVAFLGVLNTLWISVVLRRREIGLLRSVGATRGQVVRSIVIEAAVLGAVGAVLGLVGGAIVEWVLLRRILPADTGWTYPLVFPWATAAVVAVLAVLTSAVAGWFPARAAARVPIPDALGYE